MTKLFLLAAVMLSASVPVHATVSLNDEFYPWQIVGSVEVCPGVLEVDALNDGELVRFYHPLDGDENKAHDCAVRLNSSNH